MRDHQRNSDTAHTRGPNGPTSSAEACNLLPSHVHLAAVVAGPAADLASRRQRLREIAQAQRRLAAAGARR